MTTRGRRSGRRLRAPAALARAAAGGAAGGPGPVLGGGSRRGRTSEGAAREAGLSPPVGARWFRRSGGTPPSHLSVSAKPLSGRHLSFEEREEIALLRAQGRGVRAIAQCVGRAPSTISRELRRNAATRHGGLEYRATTAQWHADRSARRPRASKLARERGGCAATWRTAWRAGSRGADGVEVPGPQVAWTKRRSVRRQHRRWGRAWSPEQISARLEVDFPEDETMRISHEAIYQSLFIQGRGGLRRELSACLRSGRALRVPRARARGRHKSAVSPEIMISARPAEAADRAVPGHWEGDLILGLGSSAIGTLVERTTRFTMLLHLPRMPGPWNGAARQERPAARRARRRGGARRGRGRDHDAARAAAPLAHLGPGCRDGAPRRAADRARSAHLLLRSAEPLAANRHQREHQWALAPVLPQGHGPQPARAPASSMPVAVALNGRPRKTLGWRTPAEALDELLTTAHNTHVATTG